MARIRHWAATGVVIQSTREYVSNDFMLNIIQRYFACMIAVASAFLVSACDDCCDKVVRGTKIEKLSVTSQNEDANTDNNVTVETLARETKINTPLKGNQSLHSGVTTSISVAAEDIPLTYAPLDEVTNNNKSRQVLNLTLPRMAWESDAEHQRNSGVLPDVFRPLPQEQKMNLSGRLHWDESEAARQLSVEDSIKGAEVELKFFLP